MEPMTATATMPTTPAFRSGETASSEAVNPPAAIAAPIEAIVLLRLVICLPALEPSVRDNKGDKGIFWQRGLATFPLTTDGKLYAVWNE
jgi:hypothetical protein